MAPPRGRARSSTSCSSSSSRASGGRATTSRVPCSAPRHGLALPRRDRGSAGSSCGSCAASGRSTWRPGSRSGSRPSSSACCCGTRSGRARPPASSWSPRSCSRSSCWAGAPSGAYAVRRTRAPTRSHRHPNRREATCGRRSAVERPRVAASVDRRRGHVWPGDPGHTAYARSQRYWPVLAVAMDRPGSVPSLPLSSVRM